MYINILQIINFLIKHKTYFVRNINIVEVMLVNLKIMFEAIGSKDFGFTCLFLYRKSIYLL